MPTPAPDLPALGLAVARARRARGWSLDRLAGEAGVHRKTLIQIEAGRTAPRVTTLFTIAHALGVPLTDLVAVLDEE